MEVIGEGYVGICDLFAPFFLTSLHRTVDTGIIPFLNP
jgi:hypothetical protein